MNMKKEDGRSGALPPDYDRPAMQSIFVLGAATPATAAHRIAANLAPVIAGVVEPRFGVEQRGSGAQDRGAGHRIDQRHILQGLDPQFAITLRNHREDQRVDLMRPGRMRRAGAEA